MDGNELSIFPHTNIFTMKTRTVDLSPEAIRVAFDQNALKHERRKLRKREECPREYHHQPSQAASSFSRTATSETFSKKETHKLSRSLIDHLNSKRCNRPAGYAPMPEEPYIIPAERSPQRNRPPSPRQRQFRPSVENNELPRFSESILRNTSSRNHALQDLAALRAARADWSESDEQSSIQRRPMSMGSLRKKKSVDIPHVNTSIPMRTRDDESVYRGRGLCFGF